MKLLSWFRSLFVKDDIYSFVAHIETTWGTDLARILVRTRLRGKVYESEKERRWLEEKLKKLQDSP